jgi:hypothetical protein
MDWACPACFGDIFGPDLAGHLNPPERAPETLLGGPLSDVQVRPGAVVLLWGPPGGGKTTLAIRACSPKTLFLTNEMAPDLVLRYARRLGVRIGRIAAPQHDADGGLTWPDAAWRVVVLDSVTHCPADYAAMLAIRDYARSNDAIAVVIAQATKAGDMRGDRRIEHDAEIVIRVGDNRYDVTKNRFGPTFSGVLSKVDQRGYYSIEGEAGSYRLAAHPSRRATWNAPLLAWERAPSGAPLPPVAVAARSSALYPSGYVEPPDIDERVAFAARLGVPIWRPTNG